MARRILQIIPTLDRGGAEKQLVLLSGELVRRGYDVHVCALTRGGPRESQLREAHVPLAVIGKRWKFDPLAYRRLKQHIRDLRPDLVHTWLFAANSYGRTAALAAGAGRLVASERCVDPWKRWYELSIDRRLARRTDKIVAVSPAVRDFYVDRGIDTARFCVIPGGVAAARPSGVTRQELLAELGLPPDARLIGGVGRLWPQKRWRDLIWASDLLKVIRDDVHLLIIGDGPLQRSLTRYRDLVRIRDKVHFLGERDDVWRLLPHFDLLWLASQYEGLPNVVMEAMAAGVPVVASDIPGTRDLIVSGETGYLVAVGDRAGFARRANQLLNEPELAQRVGQAGQRFVLDHYSVEKMVDRHEELYRELLD